MKKLLKAYNAKMQGLYKRTEKLFDLSSCKSEDLKYVDKEVP